MSRPIDITRTQEKTYTNLLNKYKKALKDD